MTIVRFVVGSRPLTLPSSLSLSVTLHVFCSASSSLLSPAFPCFSPVFALPPSPLTDLLTLYSRLYTSVAEMDRPLMARALSSLLLHCSPQCDVSLNNLYIFYFNALKNISEEKDSKLLEELLTGLCKYCTIAGPNGRSRVCSLGKSSCKICHLDNL